jgi:hypothetical protein
MIDSGQESKIIPTPPPHTAAPAVLFGFPSWRLGGWPPCRPPTAWLILAAASEHGAAAVDDAGFERNYP